MRRIAFFQGAGCGGGGACAGVVGLRLRCAGRQAFARRRAGGSRRPQGGSSCVGVCRSSGGDDCLFAVKANRPGSAILIMAMDAPSWERQIRRIAPGQNENCWAGFDVRRRRFLRRCFPPAPSAVPGSASPQVPADPPPDIEYAETVEKGRGRIEVRRLALSCEVVPHLRWPGAARVCRIERICERAGKTSRAVSRAVIGLPRARAGASRTAATIAAMSPCAKTPAVSAPATRRRRWRRCGTPCCGLCIPCRVPLPPSAQPSRKTALTPSPPQNTAFFELPCDSRQLLSIPTGSICRKSSSLGAVCASP